MNKSLIRLATALTIATLCGTLAAQIPATRPPNPNITPPGPQAHQPPGGRQVMTGTIYGFVYWDAQATSHLGPSICNALTITVAAASQSPYTPFGPMGTQSHLIPIATVHPPLTSVNTTSYDGCAYSYNNAPLNQNLYVKLNLTQAVGTLMPATVAKNPAVGPVQFNNAPCSTLPPLTKATVGNLLGSWGSCQNVAYDVNLPLVIRQSLTPLSAGGGSGGNQSGAPGGFVQTNSGPQNTPVQMNPGPTQQPMLSQSGSNGTLLSNQSSAGSPSRGMLVPAVTPSPTTTAPVNSQPGTPAQLAPTLPGGGGTVQLNPQPYPPKAASGGLAGFPSSTNAAGNGALNGGLRTAANPSFTGGVKPALLPALSGGVRVVSGRRVRNSLAANSSIIAVLHQQRQASVPSSHTLSAAPFPTLAALPSNARPTSISAPYAYSNLLSPKQNAWCKQSEAQGGAPTIFSVAGNIQGQGVVYSPDPQANPYTIIGCGFGNSSGTVQLQLLQSQSQNSGWSNSQTYQTSTLYTVQFTIQSWSDHEIVASVATNTSGIPDWSWVGLQVKARQSGYAAGGQFVASRATVLLANIPQNQASLYQSGSPYFLSPVSNYYGLNGTVGVMRQGLAGPVAGQDQFSLKLAPGFVVDSTQTDLLVANTSSSITSQPATVNGNTITVTYPVLTAGSGNSSNYYSIYGLKVWVTGPTGVPPIVTGP